jgi:hypothetical protein
LPSAVRGTGSSVSVAVATRGAVPATVTVTALVTVPFTPVMVSV